MVFDSQHFKERSISKIGMSKDDGPVSVRIARPRQKVMPGLGRVPTNSE
jgi:hypothetical protein